MLHAVIMAGGFGTRFWPASRANRPKQLLNLSGPRSMIQATVDRLAGLVPPERILVVTNERLVGPISEQLPELFRSSILGEPCKRDTAPCIGWAAALIAQHDPEGLLVVMPSDHVIPAVAPFQAAIRLGAELVEHEPRRIVTFGIAPTYPAEIFGYVERGEALAESTAGLPVYRVKKFREKPPIETARAYLAAGDFYWNSGIFVWRARTILEALAERQPAMFAHLQAIAAAAGTPDQQSVLSREFAAIRPISIDYAVMEQADDVVVVEAPFAWDDVGGWQSLARLHADDENCNTILGKHLGVNTQGTIVRGSDDHLIVTLGLRDCLIVHTPDATLVANKHDEEAIRQVVKQLEARGWDEYL
ncbi:MAG TPA: mannose-1-phosphate guanylyltransferase [Pirellulales bacterium]|jgi:mannose-1-phosphate guanylyltransferase|nr:mannose-1-phosphate guanylyltransferase [Pirellulales bacterium]